MTWRSWAPLRKMRWMALRSANRQRLRWAIRIRGAVIALFLGVAVTAWMAGFFRSLVPSLAAAAAGTVMNVAAGAAVRRGRGVIAMMTWSGVGDALIITYVVASTGGTASPFLFLYVVQVLTSALVVDAGAGAIAAVLAVTFCGVAVWLGPLPVALPATPGGERLVWGLSLALTLVLLAFIGGYLARRLARRERELAGAHRRLRRSMDRVAHAHTELQGAYERLARAEAQLVSTEKMRSLGVLVAGLAHELGNPLTVLAGNVDPLEEQLTRYEDLVAAPDTDAATDDVERRRRRLEQVAECRVETRALLANCREATQRAVALLAQLRAFGQGGQSAVRRYAPVKPGIVSTIALVRHRLPRDVVVHTRLADVPDVRCVPAELNQVFMNLLLNAADALRPGGTLEVDLEVAGDAILIRIADDGAGIAPDALPHVFEPFFTTKEVGAGTGLGLAISHAIIARHGGSLTAEASAAGGAAFTIRLPLDADDEAAAVVVADAATVSKNAVL